MLVIVYYNVVFFLLKVIMRYRFKSTRFQSTEAKDTNGEDSDNSRESADKQWQEREERKKEGGAGNYQMNQRSTR